MTRNGQDRHFIYLFIIIILFYFYNQAGPPRAQPHAFTAGDAELKTSRCRGWVGETEHGDHDQQRRGRRDYCHR